MAISDDKFREYCDKNDKVIETLKEKLKEQTSKKRDEIDNNPILLEDFLWLYRVSTNEYPVYFDFNHPVQDIFDEIKKIEDELEKAERELRYKAHFNGNYKVGVFEIRTYQKDFEDTLKEYNELCQKYYGGGYKGILIYLCEKHREEQHWALLNRYYPDIACYRAIVYYLSKEFGFYITQDNNSKEKIKYALLEEKVRDITEHAPNILESSIAYESQGFLDNHLKNWMYEIIFENSDINETNTNKDIISFAAQSITGYISPKYYENYRKYDIDYLLWAYPETIEYIIEHYQIKLDFNDFWNLKNIDPNVNNYVFEPDARTKIKSKDLEKNQKLNPPFILESCITKCIELKKKLKDFELSHDLTKKKDAMQYYQLKWEYLAMKRNWTIEAYRIAKLAYEVDINKAYTFLKPYIKRVCLEEPSENFDGTWTQGKYMDYSYNYEIYYEKSTEYEFAITNEENSFYEKDRNNYPIYYKLKTRKGIQQDWETHLGIYKDDPEWNIIKFTEKEEYNKDTCMQEPDYQKALKNEMQILQEIADTQNQLSKSRITRKKQLINKGFPYTDYINIVDGKMICSWTDEELGILKKYKSMLTTGLKEQELLLADENINYISPERKLIYRYNIPYLRTCSFTDNEYTDEVKRVIQELVDAGVSEEEIIQYIAILNEEDHADKDQVNHEINEKGD